MKLHGENESYQSRTSAENMKSETKCGENEVILVKMIIAMTKFNIDRQTDNICLFRPYSNIFLENKKYDIIKKLINGLWRPTLRLIAAIMWATKLLQLVIAHQN